MSEKERLEMIYEKDYRDAHEKERLEMIYEKGIECLELEWSVDSGFFWEIRQGRFTLDAFERTLEKIRAISIEEDAFLPRRLVSLLWYVPIFMQWQIDRVRESDGDVTAYVRACTMMVNEIERLLGVP